MQLSLGLARSPLESVRDALLCEFGAQRPQARMDPISQLVKSSISGRTQDAVSWNAFLCLRAEFKCWEDLARAPVAAVARIIQDVTFPGDKARHLTTALKMIEAKVGWLSLSHLKTLEVDQARWELQALPGVGVKVAACVLNFSDLAMRSLVVDTHVDRVAKRIGLVGSGDATHTYHTLMSLSPDAWTADDLFELHWLMKRGLGQMLCPHEGPSCGACPVRQMCAKAGVGHSAEVLAWRPRPSTSSG
ncbi:endonuclease III [Caulobacter sp. RHG1]|uniref:endonuclease III domain-containing protein n=1 Tax=Caulobacter sp. (strain RHG1) TaxID=2545762 RepID=UPI001556CFCC|nr:endonuclease III [Caulobacter sp. RHG1]NQE62847.1 Endonuclease III [Caulobacter sp. RHG1]